MPSNAVTITLGWILAIACMGLAAYWSMAMWIIHLANTAMPRVRAGLKASVPEGGWPLVSVVIPAHNEEQFIEHALQTLRASRYPALEIIIAADRCTDGTAAIVKRHTQESAGAVRLVEISQCPAGWSGKCHASWTGAKAARGQWLLFADADTTFHPDLIRAAMGVATEHRLDFLSLLGTLTCSRDFELTDQPVAAMSLMKMFPIHRANRNDRPGRRPFANGQFMLFRASVYESIGTHEHIRDAILEDLRFARRLDFKGHRMGLVLAEELFTVRMYETPEEFERGWTRIFVEAANRNAARLQGHVWRLRTLAAGPVVQAAALGLGMALMRSNPPLAWSLVGLSLAAAAVQVAALVRAYGMQGAPRMSIWRFPLGCMHVARIFADAAADLRKGRTIEWASLTYRIEDQPE